MSRQRRQLSSTQTYHIMMRGNERKNIFLDNEDRTRFINTLYEKKREKEYSLYAYCLMDNHVHLLIKEGTNNISRIMKRINTSYACYFNKKYDRVGHVFQDRYKSETIERESYLLSALRYIHNNPVQAGIVKTPIAYDWSSYREYMEGSALIEREEILSIFSAQEKKAIQLLVEFTNEKNKDEFLEVDKEDKSEQNKEDARNIIEDFLISRSIKDGDIMNDRKLRDELIFELKSKKVLSIRQIAELLHIDRNVVQRIK